MRNYLVNIHRFYHYYYPDNFDHAIMPVIIFSLTFNSILYSIDVLFFESTIFSYLDSINKYMVTVPGYLTLIVVYFWYKRRTPDKKELKRFNEGRWLGVLICIFSLIIALMISILSLS